MRFTDGLADLIPEMHYGRTAELKDRLAEEALENKERRRAAEAAEAANDAPIAEQSEE